MLSLVQGGVMQKRLRRNADENNLKAMQNENVFEVEEILANILSRLPARSLLLYKTVCKQWRDLIVSPFFMRLKLIESQRNPSTYLYYPCPRWSDEEFLLRKIDGDNPRTLPGCTGLYFREMICSFNGLICCGAVFNADDPPLGICVCNPATGEVLLLPPNPDFRSKYPRRIGVSFEPATISMGYKVFEFCHRGGGLYDFTVYSSVTGSWKSLGTVEHAPSSSHYHVCIDGTVYWLGNSRIDGQIFRHIVAVDEDEKFSVIRIPKENIQRSYLINLEGRLSLVIINRDLISFDVWSLRDSKKPEWFKAFSRNTPYDFYRESLRFVSARRNELFFATYRFYVLYNMVDGSWERFEWESENGSANFVSGFGWGAMFTSFPVAYTESFLPCSGQIDCKPFNSHGLLLPSP